MDLKPINLQFRPTMEPWCGPTNLTAAAVSTRR
jgi:hypothetical protein